MSEKKLWEKLLGDDLKAKGIALIEFIEMCKSDKSKRFAEVAERYYEGRHDIKDSHIFYEDYHGEVREDELSSNIKIAHPFFMEITDQKVQYLLSKGVQIVSENAKLQERLDEFIDEDFQLFMDKIVTGATIKGAEYAYARTGYDDRIEFDISELGQTETLLNDQLEEVAVIRFYRQDAFVEGKKTTIKYAEIYTAEEVTYFVMREDDEYYKLNENVENNPRPYVLAVDDDGQIISRSYGRIPFYRLVNNSQEKSDLYPIKDLIDDYDLMSSFLSSNLQDYDRPIVVVKGYQGDNLMELKQRLKAGVIRAGSPTTGGDVDIRTYNVPYEGRKEKMKMDKEAIYKFGMAFDSSQLGDGNITNIVIKSRYSLLDLKCNKMEPRVRSLIKWCLEFVLADIQRLYGETYSLNDIEVVLERNMIFNENDKADKDLKEAQTLQIVVGSLIAIAPYIDEMTVIDKICEYFELDPDEVKAKIDDEPQALESDEGDPDGGQA